MPRLGRSLASRILVAVLGIVVTTMAVGFALFARLTTHAEDARAIEQATGIAVTLGRVLEVALYSAIALALGVAASLLLARTIKRVTFGVEPSEIAALMQEREAMLHGIREGVLAVDAKGAINVLNDEARALLGLEAARL